MTNIEKKLDRIIEVLERIERNLYVPTPTAVRTASSYCSCGEMRNGTSASWWCPRHGNVMHLSANTTAQDVVRVRGEEQE